MNTGKRIWKIVLFIICCVFLQTTAAHAVQSVKVEAAVKSGLVKSGKKYYFYQAGKKVVNRGKTIDGHKYYFGKDGAAYAALKAKGMSDNIVAKKVNGKVYGFDVKGRMVKGIYCTEDGKLYCFNAKNGKYKKAATKKYQKALKYLANAATIRKYLGEPLKTTESSSCFRDGGTDLLLTYEHICLSLYRNDTTGEELVLGVFPR